MKAYVSDPEDLKQDPLYQETWDDMVINVSSDRACSSMYFYTDTFYSITFMDVERFLGPTKLHSLHRRNLLTSSYWDSLIL